MLYGIFGDIHSNFEALTVILDFFNTKQIEKYLCVGDIVGYGPNPNECVNIMKKLSPLKIVVGNHDRAACGLKDITWFNEYAQKAIIWTRQILTQENQIYLSELPKIITFQDICLVHGSPRDPLDEYLLTREQYQENLTYLTTPFTFIGHSHIPFIFGTNSTYLMRETRSVIISKQEKYIINPGAAGQPRDGNNKASCALYDTVSDKLDFLRLDYDIHTTQKKMRVAKLPAYLIERLQWGK